MQKRNHNYKSYLIAITGNFGTGKSTVGEILRSEGFLVIDTDEIVREILSKKNLITQKLINIFGENIKSADENYLIDKRALAKIVFNDKEKRELLESIIHPEVEKVLNKIFKESENEKIVFILIPLLFECGLEKNYDESWCVICNENIQKERLIKKGFTLEMIDLRLKAQMPQAEKEKKADFTINNSKSIKETKEQVFKKLSIH